MPFPKKLFLLRACWASLLVTGCLFSTRDANDARNPNGSTAHLQLKPAALVRGTAPVAYDFDSLCVRLTADDMQPLEFSFAGDSLSITLSGLPPGSNRTVAASLFRAGRLLYLGQATVELKRDAPLNLALRCDPQFSRVSARFHIPVSVAARLRQGSLQLSGPAGKWSAGLQIQDEFGSFLVDEIPGGVKYDMSLSLSDSAGKALYESSQTGVYLPLGEEAHWDLPLLSAESDAGIYLDLKPPMHSEVSPAFPARRRSPSRNGEVILSEFYAIPAAQDSLSQGEWWELFNRSADTLVLSGCRLAHDRLGGVTRSFAFDSTHVLPPGKAATFGRSLARADFHYSDFTWVNTAASMLLLCSGDSLVIDSLRYSSVASDSTAVPARDGKVTSLDAGSLSRRADPAGWCLTAPSDSAQAGTPGFASPGTVESCAP